MSDNTSCTTTTEKHREHQIHHDHQRIRNQARARKVAHALKRHALEAEELAGLSAVEQFTPQKGGLDSEQRFDAFVLAALAQLTRRVDELEQQLETLREHTDQTESDEGMPESPPEDEEGTFS